MKLLAIINFKVGRDADPVICNKSLDVSHLNFFQRSSGKEFLVFLSRTLAKRVTPNQKVQVTQEGHVLFALANSDGLCSVAVADTEYPLRVAFSMLLTVQGEFAKTFRGKYESPTLAVKDDFLPWVELDAMLAKYQKPEEADKILAIHKNIEETKVVMHDAIDKVLERGEKIDNLVAKSNDLSVASKTFYTEAKKTNSCCTIM